MSGSRRGAARARTKPRPSTRMRWAIPGLLSFGMMTLAFACGDNELEPEDKCDPGTNIFCRCPGGDPGTRDCLSDGENFGECVVAPETPCGERIECIEDTTVPCVCPSGEPGLKTCLRDESSYGECEIGFETPCPIAPDPDGPSSSSSGASTGVGGSGAGGATPTCDHGVCETGEALSAECDSCTMAVCAADSYCCDTKWDIVCLGVVDEQCDSLCSGPAECVHDICMEGVALDPMCDPCVTEICNDDAYCCGDMMGEWDALCLSKVMDTAMFPACTGVCGCVHDECATGVKLDPVCSPCATAVCALDSYCCDNSWDALCVSKAQAEPSCGC
jgi:hypothetical protein